MYNHINYYGSIMRLYLNLIFSVLIISFQTIPIKAEVTLNYLISDNSSPFYLKMLEAIPDEGKIQIGPDNAKNTIIEFFDYFCGYCKKIHPELIFYYIYGLLNSRNYLRKYKEQLRLDFPKIYFRKKEKEFLRISELGKKLTQIQLNKNCNSENFFQGNDLKFIKKKYEIVNEKLFINETSFFIVNNDTAKFEIGGYKILEKYINSREDFLNESKSISEINNLIYRINETINIQKIIDDEFNF